MGIPEEVPPRIASSFRAPSYRAIAVAILSNDVTLKTLGFRSAYSEYCQLSKKAINDSQQMNLFY